MDIDNAWRAIYLEGWAICGYGLPGWQYRAKNDATIENSSEPVEDE
jgi:hypothetical protein